MKKIFSLLMVAAIILTMSITSMAATVTGMKQTITETDDGITVTVTVGNVTDFVGCTAIVITDKLVSDGNYTLGEKCSGWTVTPTVNKAGYIKYVVSSPDMTNIKVSDSGEFVVMSYTATKATGVEEISASDFSIATTGLQISKITATVAGASQAKPTSKTDSTLFTVDYVDNRSGGSTTTGWTETNSDGETITIKFPTQQSEVGNADALTGTTKPATSHVEFGKATTALEGVKVENGKITNADKSYFITYNGQKFYGLLDVAAGKSWAIVIVDTSAN